MPAGLDDLWPLAAGEPTEILEEARGGLHHLHEVAVDLPGYAESGLPQRTMGRSLDEDLLFFAAALAGGTALGSVASP